MFGGWFALIAVSFLVYRVAVANGRSGLRWVGLLWLYAFGAGFVTSLIVALMFDLRGTQFATEREGTNALVLPAGIGMLIGAVICVWLASRSTTQSDNEPGG
jgi:hypothetical protein